MKQVTITKSYSRVISKDYQSYKFEASLTETFTIGNDEEEFKKASELFNKVRSMVEFDIQQVFGGQI